VSSHSKRSTEESGSSSSGDEDEPDDQRSIEGSEGSADEDGEGDHPKPGSGMEGGGNAGAPPKPKRAPKAAGPVKLHYLGPRTKCKWCPATLWPEEKKGVTKCCGNGKYVLGAQYNPPIDDEYLALLQLPHFSHNSRFLNDKLCFTAHGTFPSRQDGGLGWHDMGAPAFVHLYGKVYTVFHDPHAGPSFLDSYQLGSEFVYDGAKNDLGVDFANQFREVRKYIKEVHPFAKKLPSIDKVSGDAQHLDITNKVIKIDAAPGGMDVAIVSSGVGENSSQVMYFDLGRHMRGELPKPIKVDNDSRLYELLQFPVLFPKGVGGYFHSIKRRDAGPHLQVKSTSGSVMTMHKYTKAMVFQNPVLGYAGRLMQQWLLSQHSREMETTLKFHSTKLQDRVVRRAQDKNGGEGKRAVSMASTVPGSFRFVQSSHLLHT
jgi:hypothetical protein